MLSSNTGPHQLFPLPVLLWTFCPPALFFVSLPQLALLMNFISRAFQCTPALTVAVVLAYRSTEQDVCVFP